MSDRSHIEWTDATWNPVTGCTKVSPGCDHCYAETLAERFRGTAGHYFENGFDVQLRPEKLDQPLRWRRPRRVFVNSMSDLFHDQVPDDYIAQIFGVMACAPQHKFQILTKRHGRMRSLLSRGRTDDFLGESFVDEVARLLPPGWAYDARMKDPAYADTHERRRKAGDDPYRRIWFPWPLPNVWLGVSVENQQWADIRIPALLQTPAAVRFISAEPLLGPVDLKLLDYANPNPCRGCSGIPSPAHLPECGIEPGAHCPLDWVIVGGESGHGARVMQLDWACSLRDQCTAAGVPFLFKQWGEWEPDGVGTGVLPDQRDRYGETVFDGQLLQFPWRRVYRRVGKRTAGRELDGRTWDEYPGGEQ